MAMEILTLDGKMLNNMAPMQFITFSILIAHVVRKVVLQCPSPLYQPEFTHYRSDGRINT
jgi:hypothetical protein